jgi:RNA polymerase sigma-70 factor (ECF subfamily)
MKSVFKDESKNNASEDAALISRCQAGDVEAFGKLYRRYLDPIYRYVRVRVGSEQIAEDLTETIFLRAFETLNRYQERGKPFSAFLYQIARNLLVDYYRKQHKEVALEDVERVAKDLPTMDERIIRDERLREIYHALDGLPPDYQEVIRLRVMLGLPTSTVSTWMERKEGATRVLLHRALQALRRRLDEIDA